MKITKEDREFNNGIAIGLAGGLIVVWSQIFMNETIKSLHLPDNYIIKSFGIFLIAILFFLMVFISQLLCGRILKKNKKEKKIGKKK